MNVILSRRLPAFLEAAPRPSLAVVATLVAVLAGMLFAFSPAGACMALLLAVVIRWAGRGLPPAERRWVVGTLVIAAALRAAAILAIAWRNNPIQSSFSTVVGDALYAIRMSLWIRNTYLGIPIRPRDYLEVFDIDYGRTSYHAILAVFQVFVGPAPYGVHALSVVLYLAGVVAMYRTVRAGFGPIPAFTGLGAILFLPTLFLWSILPLKESVYFFCASMAISAMVWMARSRTWREAATPFIVTGGMLGVISSLREGGLIIATGGLAAGLVAARVVRSRLLVVTLVAIAPFVMVWAVRQPLVRDRMLDGMKASVARHLGHVRTPGTSYKLVKLDYYRADIDLSELSFDEGVQYLGKSLAAFVLVPRPWDPASRTQIFIAPQQVAWYALVVLAVIGAFAGLRRDRLLTCLLVGNVVVGVIVIAPNSGNVGTLFRHRDMVVPFVAWLGGMGMLAVLSGVAAWRTRHQDQENG